MRPTSLCYIIDETLYVFRSGYSIVNRDNQRVKKFPRVLRLLASVSSPNFEEIWQGGKQGQTVHETATARRRMN